MLSLGFRGLRFLEFSGTDPRNRRNITRHRSLAARAIRADAACAAQRKGFEGVAEGGGFIAGDAEVPLVGCDEVVFTGKGLERCGGDGDALVCDGEVGLG